MRKLSKYLIPFVLVFCFAVSALNVCAADERLGTVVDGSLLTEQDSSDYMVYPRLRNSYLSNGVGNLSIVGVRQVRIAGATTAYTDVDIIGVALTIQRLVNGSWNYYTKLGPKYAYNAHYVSAGGTYSVPGGYYYRVLGAHTINEGSTTEGSTSYTDGIWVN